ncbi:MAG: hypothetical protein HY749_10870 [Gammaproteobacteria bacterium]|nr:hypothetical protein [Gammaproteobacteria bacterium]
MKPVVFLGPSLAHAEAAALLDAEYRPPAAAGDLFTAARRGPPAIVLVDGYFERVPAVWHKEILYALDRGIAVYGASSMGALRAAELHSFGMIGVGSIFERYRDGVLEDDDEVAVRHVAARFGFRAASEAMVNLRDGLARAAAEGVIGEAEATVLAGLGKALFYPARSWQALTQAGVAAGLDAARLARLLRWAAERRPNTKRDEARAVLERVAADLAGEAPRRAPPFAFERSIFWERLVDSLGGQAASEDGTAAIAAFAKLTAPGGDWRAALARRLLRLDARRREWQADPAALDAAAAALRSRHGLQSAESFAAWLDANGVDRSTLLRLAEDDLLRTEFTALEARGCDQAFVDELKARGLWAGLTAAAARQDAAARELGDSAPLPERAGYSAAELLAWYGARFRSPGPDLAQHAHELGFQNTTDFLVALTRARLADEE